MSGPTQRSRGCQDFLAPAAARRIPAWGLMALWLMSYIPGVAAPTEGVTRTVEIQNLQFSPQTLTVHLGDRIVWVNKDLFPHTVTAANQAFDSKSIAANASWTYVATKTGKFAYRCSFHPTMNGTLIVQ